jgi:hypothetical protein
MKTRNNRTEQTDRTDREYSLVYDCGWRILHRGIPVRTFQTEGVARVFFEAWREGRQPERMAVADALSNLFREATA